MLTFSFHVHYHLNKLWYLHTYFLIIYIWNKGKTIKVENIVLNLTKILVSLFRLFCVQDGHFYRKKHMKREMEMLKFWRAKRKPCNFRLFSLP